MDFGQGGFMGMSELEEGLAAVNESDMAQFVGPRDPDLVAAGEKELGLVFPPTYRRFVTELGAGGLGGQHLFGITTSDFVHSVAMNMVWLALDERRIAGLPDWLIPVGDTGMGEYYVLDTSRSDDDGENPVVIWAAWGPQDELEAVASDFGVFFLQVVHEQFGEFY